MKKQILFAIAVAAVLSMTPADAQSVVRETTTTTTPATTTTTTVQPTEIAGTVTEYAPDAIVLRSEGAAAPVRYSFTKTTEYVDEAGNRITQDIVKSGVPVTVRYIPNGDNMVVDRVIVHRAAPVAPAAVTEKTTTTTTTTEEGRKHHKDRDKD
jgi:hypothetical protein